MLSLLAVARLLYPRPQDLAAGPAQATTQTLPRVFWVYAGGAALAAAGFADFPLIAYHFQHAGTVSPALTPVFYAVAMAVSGTGSLVLGRVFDRMGIGVLVPLTVVAAAYAPLAFLGGFWAILVGVSLCGAWGWACRSRSSRPRWRRWSPRTAGPLPTACSPASTAPPGSSAAS
jgi:predicted MFS family arabinose efflux permease